VQEEPAETVGQEQARLSAESYLDFMSFSEKGLREQLEYEEHTAEDIDYAVKSLGDVDWNAQAAGSAEAYMEMGGFSRASLLEQLLYEGFTQEQAEHGVSSVGF
jgi:colicin import membrane protein